MFVVASGGKSSVRIELNEDLCCAEVGTNYDRWSEVAQCGYLRAEIANGDEFAFDFAFVEVVAREGRVIGLIAHIPIEQYEQVRGFCLAEWGHPDGGTAVKQRREMPMGAEAEEEYERLYRGGVDIWRAEEADGFQAAILLHERSAAAFYVPNHPDKMVGEPFVKLKIKCHMVEGYSADSTDCPLFQEDD
jgi:hypothetical protein